MSKLEANRDVADQEMIEFFSNSEIVTGCFFMKEEKSLFLIHEIILN
jgi:hypothetical protein